MSFARAWWLALFCVVLLAPVPVGAIETEWSMPLALAGILLGVVPAILRPMIRGERPRFPPVLVPLAILLVWSAIPLVPLPRGVVGVLSPDRLTVPPLPGEPGPVAMSFSPGDTLEQSILLLAVLYLMWSVVRSSPRPAFRLIAVVGVAHALLGLVLPEVGGSGRIPGTDTTRIGVLYVADEVLTPFGTYVNKNHFACLMLIGAGGCMAVLLRRLGAALARSEGPSLRSRLGSLPGRRTFRLLVPGVGLLVILLAVFSSGSRGAAVALLVAVIGVPVIVGPATGRHRFGLVAVGSLLIVGALLAATTGSSVSVLERLRPDGRFMNRPRLWHDVLVMTGRSPVFGIGAGAFEVGFPRYQSFDDQRRFTHAEGDWMQYLGETGVPGACFLFAFGVVLIRRFLRLMRSGGTNAALAAGGFVGVAGVVAHGCLDSGLHMPANLLAASILTAAILAIPCPDMTRAQELLG